jgi:UDP-N-acetylglucosamine acyltransferase
MHPIESSRGSPETLPLVRSAEAESASAEVLAPPRIHPTAVISPGARLGKGVVIGPFSVIDDDVEIGTGTILGPHATILRFTTLGRNCRIHSGAVLGDLPQDQAYSGAESRVEIADSCVIREGVTIHRGTRPGSVTSVGEGSLLMACSHVGHNSRVGRRVTLANGALLAGYSEIGDQAFISGNCLVHQFSRVGRLAMMSGGSATQMDVPPYCITQSLTANRVVNLNVIGLRRAGIASAERLALKRAFDLLYRSGLGTTEAVTAIENQLEGDAIRELCRFIRASQRGICKFFRDSGKANQDDAEPVAA